MADPAGPAVAGTPQSAQQKSFFSTLADNEAEGGGGAAGSPTNSSQVLFLFA